MRAALIATGIGLAVALGMWAGEAAWMATHVMTGGIG